MKKRLLLAALCALFAAPFLHRLYFQHEISLFAVLAPINWSVWEQAKPAFWPFLLSGLLLFTGKTSSQKTLLSAHFCALFIMQILLLAALSLLNRTMGLNSDILNLFACLLAIIFGFILTLPLCRLRFMEGLLPAAGFLTAALAACVILFTFFPPELALFENPFTSAAGIYTI